MSKLVYPVILLIVSFLIASCNPAEKPAQGEEDNIYVVADSMEFQSLEPVLDSTFEKIIYTPQPEKLFTLIRIPVDEINRYKNRKNIIIVAPLNSSSQTSQYINAIIDSAAKAKIIQNQKAVIRKPNLWARGQLVMVLTAPTMQELQSEINNDSDNLLYAFQKASDDRLKQSLYGSEYENENIEGKLLKEHSWIIFVEKDYKLAIDNSKYNFVWLRRAPGSDMERWIFVHWIDNATPVYLNVDSIRTIRNRMTNRFYRTTNDSSWVVIAKDYFTTNEVNFNNRYAIMTQGLWELNTKGMGGPFISYTFFDEKSHRLYMVDGSLYAPRYYKRNLIQQMDVILQSFMTKDQLSKDRIKDLLSAAN
jgi:Domain of unknown function (DUF4837)